MEGWRLALIRTVGRSRENDADSRGIGRFKSYRLKKKIIITDVSI